jgi:hypothetical protein
VALIDDAVSRTDQADLVILANVETIRDQKEPATASAVASLIGGAPVRQVSLRLYKLQHLGCLELTRTQDSYRLTEMGAELLRRELVGWSPSIREENRRNSHLRAISGNGYLL